MKSIGQGPGKADSEAVSELVQQEMRTILYACLPEQAYLINVYI